MNEIYVWQAYLSLFLITVTYGAVLWYGFKKYPIDPPEKKEE